MAVPPSLGRNSTERTYQSTVQICTAPSLTPCMPTPSYMTPIKRGGLWCSVTLLFNGPAFNLALLFIDVPGPNPERISLCGRLMEADKERFEFQEGKRNPANIPPHSMCLGMHSDNVRSFIIALLEMV